MVCFVFCIPLCVCYALFVRTLIREVCVGCAFILRVVCLRCTRVVHYLYMLFACVVHVVVRGLHVC